MAALGKQTVVIPQQRRIDWSDQSAKSPDVQVARCLLGKKGAEDWIGELSTGEFKELFPGLYEHMCAVN